MMLLCLAPMPYGYFQLVRFVAMVVFGVMAYLYYARQKTIAAVKAVYLLFLRHSEGIVFKHLPEYRQELTEIYSRLRPGGLTEKALRSIEDVTNPMLNSINEKCARIRGAFLGQFDEYMAKSYYVDGLRGEAKKISLPRDLVIWE